MALELTIKLPSGIELENAYCRIINIAQGFFDDNKKICNVQIEFHKDKDARLAKLDPIDGFRKFYAIEFDDEEYKAGISRAMIYEELKKDQLFATAIDV